MNPESADQSRLFPKIVLGVVVLSLLLALGLGYDQWRNRSLIADLQAANTQVANQITQIENNNQVGTLYASQQILERAQANRIAWSGVARALLAQEAAVENIQFLQITVIPDGAVTITGQADSVRTIAILMQQIRNSNQFTGPFVPNISGQAGSYNFQLQFNYVGL